MSVPFPTDVEPMCKHLDEILQRKAPCQIDDEADAEVQKLGEQSEYDAALVSSACDLVGTLASVLGSDFAQLFPTFLPHMAQYYVSQADIRDSAGHQLISSLLFAGC